MELTYDIIFRHLSSEYRINKNAILSGSRLRRIIDFQNLNVYICRSHDNTDHRGHLGW